MAFFEKTPASERAQTICPPRRGGVDRAQADPWVGAERLRGRRTKTVADSVLGLRRPQHRVTSEATEARGACIPQPWRTHTKDALAPCPQEEL